MVLGVYTDIIFGKIIPLFATLFGVSFLVVIHEFGHLLSCKAFGILAPSFSIGMGPVIYQKKIGETTYKLSSIPLGGYVEIAGHEEVGQGDQKHAKLKDNRSFNAKPYWQKAIVICSGIIINLLFSYIVFSSMYFVGMEKKEAHITIQGITEGSAADKAGIKKGDTIKGINTFEFSQEPTQALQEMQKNLLLQIQNNPNTNIALHITRDKKEKKLDVTLGEKGLNGFLGAAFALKMNSIKGEYTKLSFFAAIKQGVKVTHLYIQQIASSLKTLVTQKTLQGVGGPVMIFSTSYEMAQRGLFPFLMFLAILSCTLAFMNVLPLGALDGGQFLFITIEALIRRELPDSVKGFINLGSWLFFMALTLILSYRDIVRLFS